MTPQEHEQTRADYEASNPTQVGPVLRAEIADAINKAVGGTGYPELQERLGNSITAVVETALVRREAARARIEASKKADDFDAIADISGQEVLTRVLTYGLGVYLGRWSARRAARKHGAPDWAVDMAGRLTLLVGGRAWAEAAHLDGDGAKEIGKYLGDRLLLLSEMVSD